MIWAGKRPNRLPNKTATMLWMRKARAEPIKTAQGLLRVANTSAAMAVLSGNSAKKIRAKVDKKRGRSKVKLKFMGNRLPGFRGPYDHFLKTKNAATTINPKPTR